MYNNSSQKIRNSHEDHRVDMRNLTTLHEKKNKSFSKPGNLKSKRVILRPGLTPLVSGQSSKVTEKKVIGASYISFCSLKQELEALKIYLLLFEKGYILFTKINCMSHFLQG